MTFYGLICILLITLQKNQVLELLSGMFTEIA